MIRILVIGFFLSIVAVGKAQDGVKHLFFRGGATYKLAGQASVGFDFPSKYHSAYELALSYYRTSEDYENVLIGLNYKPVIVRNKNTNFRFRLGTYLGTDFDKFVAAPNAGFEWIVSVSGKVDLMFANNNGFYFWGKNDRRWRVGAEFGLRFPL